MEEFEKIAMRLIQGAMFHEQMMNCYLFLGLYGCADRHKKHYIEESKGYAKVCEYVMKHYGRLINVSIESSKVPSLVPKSWLDMHQEEISHETRKEAYVESLKEWINWETKTLEVFCSAAGAFLKDDAIEAYGFVRGYILDAEGELVLAKAEMTNAVVSNFDMAYILQEQNKCRRKHGNH